MTLIRKQPEMHIWPYSGKRHPVGEKHDQADMSKGEYRDGRGTYKEGK